MRVLKCKHCLHDMKTRRDSTLPHPCRDVREVGAVAKLTPSSTSSYVEKTKRGGSWRGCYSQVKQVRPPVLVLDPKESILAIEDTKVEGYRIDERVSARWDSNRQLRAGFEVVNVVGWEKLGTEDVGKGKK